MGSKPFPSHTFLPCIYQVIWYNYSLIVWFLFLSCLSWSMCIHFVTKCALLFWAWPPRRVCPDQATVARKSVNGKQCNGSYQQMGRNIFVYIYIYIYIHTYIHSYIHIVYIYIHIYIYVCSIQLTPVLGSIQLQWDVIFIPIEHKCKGSFSPSHPWNGGSLKSSSLRPFH